MYNEEEWEKKMRRRIVCVAAAVLWILLPLLYPVENYAMTEEEIKQQIENIPEEGWPEAPEIDSESAIVVERSSGIILYEKNCTEERYPASTTKLMTALLTLENTTMDEVVTFSWNAVNSIGSGASHIGIRTGEQLTVRDSLCGLLIPSANEVANGLAEHIGGSIEGFVEQMNARAQQMGLIHTHFQNSNGLHEENHYTCAYDLYRILDACVSLPSFVELDSITAYVKKADALLDRDIPMGTTNLLIKKDSEYYNEAVICGKTGYTEEAGRVLATYASKDQMELICVTMGASGENHFVDTNRLLDYAYSNFRLLQLSQESAQKNGESILRFTPLKIERQPLGMWEAQNQGEVVLPVTASADQISRQLRTLENGEIEMEYTLNGYVVGRIKLEELEETEEKFAYVKQEDYTSPISGVDGKLYVINPWMLAAVLAGGALLLGMWIGHEKKKKRQKSQAGGIRKNQANDRIRYSKQLKKQWKKQEDSNESNEV